MKNIITRLAVVFSVILFFSIFACASKAQVAAPTPVPSPTTDTAQEIKAAREVLKQVVDTKAPDGNKTFADVLDKGIDLVASYASSLGDVVKSIAPQVWQAMRWQQRTTGIFGVVYWFFVPLIPLILMVSLRRFVHGKGSDRKLLSIHEDDKTETNSCSAGELRVYVSWAATSLAVFLSFFALYWISEYSMMILNPDYYAIKELISLIK